MVITVVTRYVYTLGLVALDLSEGNMRVDELKTAKLWAHLKVSLRLLFL